MQRISKVLVLAALAVLLGSNARAQGYNPDLVYPKQAEEPLLPGVLSTEGLSTGEALDLVSERLEGGDLSAFTSYLLSGYGAGGQLALVNQTGLANTALLMQTGLANLAVLFQQGNRNTTVVTQDGHRNIFGAWLVGDDNALDVTQQGRENVYLLELSASGQQLAPVLQTGDRNQAVQVGDVSMPFGIEQRGDDMQIIIQHNDAQSIPVEVLRAGQ